MNLIIISSTLYIHLFCIHLQVFVIDVTWNNSERYETYRRYSDFFSFQVSASYY